MTINRRRNRAERRAARRQLITHLILHGFYPTTRGIARQGGPSVYIDGCNYIQLTFLVVPEPSATAVWPGSVAQLRGLAVRVGVLPKPGEALCAPKS